MADRFHLVPVAHDFGAHLGSIHSARLQAVLDRFDLGTLSGAQPIPFRLFGQNLFLSSDSGESVLRGAPHDDWQFPTERSFIGIVHDQTGVRAPKAVPGGGRSQRVRLALRDHAAPARLAAG